MDFGTLLHVAKKNSEGSKNEGKYYSTKFAPPKKESKEKKLSDNIQKFLQKREQEEKERQRAEREKLANLLAMRDEKSKNKIKKMLKVTKSANKSVLDDAINEDHTAVTMEGPDQPDQDDYGYVSTTANAFYQKYIEKVKDVKEDKGFAPSRPQSLKDLSGTKERVKAAITREIEEKKSHTRTRTSTVTSSTSSTSAKDVNVARAYSTSSSKTLYDPEAERREEERKKREEEQKKAKARKPAPPPMDFQALLKLAEKKQHEPVAALLPEVKKKKEPERLLTSKEKQELEERQRAREAREQRNRERNAALTKERKDKVGSGAGAGTPRGVMEPNGRIPKLNQATKTCTPGANVTSSSNRKDNSAMVAPTSSSQTQNSGNSSKKAHSSATAPSHSASQPLKNRTNSDAAKSSSSTSNTKPHTSSSSQSRPSSSSSSKTATSLSSSALTTSTSSKSSHSSASKTPYNGPTREFPPRDPKSIKPRQFPPADVQKTRQFPPPDVRRGGASQSRPGDNRKPQASKRRILDDDDEDEYDSELDDFIDDGDDEEDYSSHIKSIFGYDKSKYRHLDEEDDAAMESNFAQVQREEYISKKIGIQEDLEDMKMEAMEKKRKMLKKRRMD